jgi:hypothetical protein
MTRKPSTELCCLTIDRKKRQRERKITCVYLTAIRSRVDTEENEKLLEIRSDRMSPKMNDRCGEDQSQTFLAFGR